MGVEAARGYGWWGTAAQVGLGCGFAVALTVQAAAIAVSWGGGYWWFGAVVGALVCGLALLRRYQRLWTAVAGLTAAGVAVAAGWFAELPREPGPAMALGLAVLIGAALRWLPPRQAGALTVAGYVVILGGLAPALPSVPAGVLLAALFVSAGVGVGLGLRARGHRRRAAVARVRREERLELARELHDVVAHHVSAIVLRTQAARLVVRRQPERGDEALAEIETAGSDALAAMRQVVGLLREARTGDGDADAGRLAELVERFGAHGPRVDLRIDGDESRWPPEVTATVYRLTREALTNVRRHAPRAATVTIRVADTGAELVVEIDDDAPPRGRRSSGGYGLVGMEERVSALGGSLSSGPGPERGWRVRATIPVRERVAR